MSGHHHSFPCGHGHHHDHEGHGHHGLGHQHAPADFGLAFALGIALNTLFVLIEAGYGWAAGSMALLADAGHNLSDVLGLVVAWAAFALSRRRASTGFTYGMGASSILAALFNAVFLLVAVGGIAWEAVLRFADPRPIQGLTMIAVALAGIVINGFTAWLFSRGGKADINIKGAYLHMLADAGVSAGVVVAGGIIIFTGWLWIDPLLSLLIALLIIAGTWGLLRDALRMVLAAVPAGIDAAAVRAYLTGLKGVKGVHDLHIWPLSTTQTALTCHLLMPKGHPGDAFIRETALHLRAHFDIHHATFQIETDEKECCSGTLCV